MQARTVHRIGVGTQHIPTLFDVLLTYSQLIRQSIPGNFGWRPVAFSDIYFQKYVGDLMHARTEYTSEDVRLPKIKISKSFLVCLRATSVAGKRK